MKKWILCLVPVLFCVECLEAQANPDLFGPTEPADYLTGRFIPEKHPLFVSLDRYGIPTGGRPIWLRKETAVALKDLYVALKRDHPAIEFWVTSGTRNRVSQKGIWEAKWSGRTLVEGRALPQSHPDPLARARKILEFSSMPGTSRHHWGTDFDLNALTNTYYNTGNGKTLFGWLQANAARFGFCQPYTAGRKGGYREERWHWSFVALSRPLLRAWVEIIKPDREKRMGPFAGQAVAIPMAPEYVETIHPACQ